MSAGEAPPQPSPETPTLQPSTAPLARQTLAYGVSGLIGPAVGILTLPVFARVFTRGEYGIVELGSTLLTVALAVADAGFTAAALRSYYDYRNEHPTERRSVLFTALTAMISVSLALTAVGIALRGDISSWVFGSRGDTTIVLLLAATIPAMSLYRFLTETMRLRMQATSYLVMTAIDTITTSGLGVAVVLATDWRVKGLFAAALFGHMLASAYGLFVVRKGVIGPWSSYELKRMAAYGLPLIPSTLSVWALALVDRLILARLRDVAEVGQYAIANRLASLLLIGTNAFLLALSPFLFSLYSEDPEQEKLARGRTLTYLTFILTLGGLVLTLFAKEVVDVVAPRFSDSYKAVGPLALGTIAYGIATVLATGISLARRTLIMMPIPIACAAINIGLNFALIPPWGFIGSAVATAVGYGALAAAYYWTGQQFYATPYELRKVVTILVLASAIGVVGVLPLDPLGLAVGLKLAAVAAFVGLLRVSGAMTGAEFRELGRFVRGMVPLPRRG
ncbi:MAG: oligosaccharide flippase family protein [Actinomycetota bacterium]|nr:oligosaccharide flippase family protein [Actinomycetota bacterium]